MDRTHSRQAQRPVQLDLFERQRRLRPANDSDPFSRPHPPVVRELALLKIDMAPKLGSEVAPGSLTLADLAARCGPTEQIASKSRYKRR